jgi:hypothetical protein
LAELLAMSIGYDFVLMKAKSLPENDYFTFDMEKENIGPNVLTLGYPGDRFKFPDGPLTYSKGLLTGFNNMTYATSAYINGGASGSPLLNAESHKVIGILSNGSGGDVQGGAMPGLVRPFHLIEQTYGISKYISGEKQRRIKELLESLSTSLLAEQAKFVLDQVLKENTLIGIDILETYMFSHRSVAVREEIVKYLRKIGYLGLH